VSAKLSPEICINKASQATAADTILRTVSRLFFFLLFSLPLMREQPNYTCMLKNLLKLYCIRTWDTWWGFVCVCVCVCVVLFYFMRPLWWDNYRTMSEAPSQGLETETDTQIIKTETSLHLNLEVFFFFKYLLFISFYFIFIYRYFFHLLIFYFYSYLFLFFIFNPLSVSLMHVQLTIN
jgi:hypothetical protein